MTGIISKSARIKAEILQIQATDPDNKAHTDAIIKFAQTNKNSTLHGEFQWDVKKAAYAHWQQTAMQLIRLHVRTEEGKPQLISLSIDRTQGGGYRAISDVVKSRKLTQVMLDDALQELERVQTKYAHLKALAGVWTAVDKVRSQAKRKAA